MTENKDVDNLIQSIVEASSLFDINDIPDLGLYMDQVITLLNTRLTALGRSNGEVAITKTMINNYVKSGVVPAPVKKKYSKNHVILIAMVYYLKNILPISDIGILTKFIEKQFLNNQDNQSFEKVLTEFFAISGKTLFTTEKELKDSIVDARTLFEDMKGEEGDKLRDLALVTVLSYDVFLKKLFIDEILDKYK